MNKNQDIRILNEIGCYAVPGISGKKLENLTAKPTDEEDENEDRKDKNKK